MIQVKNNSPVVIGDVHGCIDPLERLVSLINDVLGKETPLWFSGDIINRGPYSLQTLRKIISLGQRTQAILGNHEIHLLGVVAGLHSIRNNDTIHKILVSPDTENLIYWIRNLPLVLKNDDFLMVHAGLLPQWTISEILDLSKRLQAGFSSEQWCDFVFRIIGSPLPKSWECAYGETSQLSLALAAFTRLRFCSVKGIPEWNSKKGPLHPPPGAIPWFDIEGRCSSHIPIVFGHWAALGLTMKKNIICVDSGCVWGKELTGIQMNPDPVYRRLFQVHANQ